MEGQTTFGSASLSTRGRSGLMVLSGVLDFLGFAGFGLFPLTWVAKVPALIAIRGLSPVAAFRWGLLYGVVAYGGGYRWLAYTFEEFAGIPQVLSVALVLLVSGAMGSFCALLLGGVRLLECRIGLVPVWTLPVLNVALEFADPNFLPYNIGASQYRLTAITQIVELTGLLGLTVLIGLGNGAFFEWVEASLARRGIVRSRVAVPVVVILSVFAYGSVRVRQVDAEIANAPTLSVALVQANLMGKNKEVGPFEIIDRHTEMTRSWIESHPGTDLVVWPETVIGYRLSKHTESIGDRIDLSLPLLVGAVFGGANASSHNSILAVAPGGGILARYDKMRLIPFSETIPLIERFPTLKGLMPGRVPIARGTNYVNLMVAGRQLLPLVCYEDVLPCHLREMWRRAGPAEGLVNVSNDRWFGDTHEPRIHLALASFRSIESRRSLIRATNTGISAIVDPAGRIVSRSGQWRSEILAADVPMMQSGSTTPYLRYGDWLGWVCLAAAVAMVAAGAIRGRVGETSGGLLH